MNRIIEYSDDYKEELFKYGNSGVVLIKDKGFVLSSEFKIFTQGNKKLKSDSFMFLDINDNKTLNGIIAVNKEGIISYLSTTDKEFKNLPDLINKCEEVASDYHMKYLEGTTSAKNILILNNLGFKSIRYLSNEPEYNFLVRKRLNTNL